MSNGKGDKWRATDYKKYWVNWPVNMEKKPKVIDEKDRMSIVPELDRNRQNCPHRKVSHL